MREIPPEYLTAGITRIDLRKDIDLELKKQKTKIDEIRFREIGFFLRDKKQSEKLNKNLKLKTTSYKAGKGIEYFLEIINNQNVLFGLCRLRLTKNSAFIRELHVYGQALKIGEKAKELGQHKGLGKKLLREAEKIAKNNKITELNVISGIGARQYYRKLKYKLDKDRIYVYKSL